MQPIIYNRSVAITPSDTVNISGGACYGLVAAAAGTITVAHEDGSTTLLTISAANVGVMFQNLHFIRVNATGTTATGIRGLRPV